MELAPSLEKDTIVSLEIPPTGEYYAMGAPQEDRRVLTAVRRGELEATAKVGGLKHPVLDDLWRGNDERLVASPARKYGSEEQRAPPVICTPSIAMAR